MILSTGSVYVTCETILWLGPAPKMKKGLDGSEFFFQGVKNCFNVFRVKPELID
jgi:hypothetical protein